MMRNQSPALNRRRLRSALRRLRSESGQALHQVATALEWPPTALIRLEAGSVGVSTTELMALLRHYGLSEQAEVDRLVETARYSQSSTLAQTYGSILTPGFAEFLAQEEAARVIRQFEPQLIPGPLQTEGYARAVLRAYAGPTCPPEIIEQRVAARLARRQLILQPDGPEAFFIIDEAALRRSAGQGSESRSLMTHQLEDLTRAAEKPNVTIQIMPLNFGLYAAMRGPFVILEFEDASDGQVIYHENPEGSVLYHADVERAAYFHEVFTDLERVATPPDDLLTALESALEAHRRAVDDFPG